jgi:hypothetical protein
MTKHLSKLITNHIFFMRITLIALVAIFTSFIAQSQDVADPNAWMRAEGTLEGFAVGAQYYTFVSDANLREKSNTQAKVVTKLPIGTAVTVDAVTTDSFEQRGVKLPWIKVSCTPNGGARVSGYVWGGFMALASIHTPDDEYMPNRGVKYFTGVTAYNEAKHEITVQVRAAEKGKELSKVEFTTNGDLSYYPSFEVSFEPMNKVKAVLSVNYYYPACGYPSGNNLLFWTEANQLVKVLETQSVSEGGVFYSNEEFILPTQRGGIGDHVIVTQDHSEFTEKGNDYVRSKQQTKVSLYKWDGKKLLKLWTK